MNMEHNHLLPPTPDEALHAFMDGELDLAEEQRLFDQLAADPELRTEMKDVLYLRTAVIHDMVVPPASAETGLFSAVGFATGAAGTAGTFAGAGAPSAALSTGVAVTGSTRLGTVLYSLGSLAVGVVLSWLLFSTQPSVRDVANTTMLPPTTGTQQGIAGEPALHATVVAPADTVRVVKYVVMQQQLAPHIPNSAPPMPVVQPEQVVAVADEHATSASPLISESPTTQLSFTSLLSSSDGFGTNKATYLNPGSSMPQVHVRMRSLSSGLDGDEPTPTSVQEAILPNSAFALLFPLGTEHHVGVELGTESFRQEFTTVDETGREATILQTPVLFWMGGTYEYAGRDFAFLSGLSPFVIATVGYAYSQGPVARGTIGLAYQAFGPLKFYVGVDGSTLAYRNQDAWFNSSKWGMSYGLSVDLGAIK